MQKSAVSNLKPGGGERLVGSNPTPSTTQSSQNRGSIKAAFIAPASFA
jgi:hypothetical protein